MLNTEIVSKKIVTTTELSPMVAVARFKDKKIVFTNGCFDIIHRGHVDYLMKAADLGHVLVVGINSDASVRKLKGASRPVQDELTRATIMASFSFVTYVIVFDEDTPYRLIDMVKPDVLTKGGDYANLKEIVGYDIVTGYGGEVVTIPFVEGFSSTSILRKI